MIDRARMGPLYPLVEIRRVVCGLFETLNSSLYGTKAYREGTISEQLFESRMTTSDIITNANASPSSINR